MVYIDHSISLRDMLLPLVSPRREVRHGTVSVEVTEGASGTFEGEGGADGHFAECADASGPLAVCRKARIKTAAPRVVFRGGGGK